jgi:hypothetical protein
MCLGMTEPCKMLYILASGEVNGGYIPTSPDSSNPVNHVPISVPASMLCCVLGSPHMPCLRARSGDDRPGYIVI